MTVELTLGPQQEKIIEILKEAAWLSTPNLLKRLFPKQHITESLRSSVHGSLRRLEAKGLVSVRKIQKDGKNRYRTGKNRYKGRQLICLWSWVDDSS